MRNLLLVVLLIIFTVICFGQKNGKYRKYQTKVFGGYIAGETEFAHQVGIGMNILGFKEIFCSGSLISKWLILTAGHCHESFSKLLDIYIMVGSKNILEGGDWYQVSNIITHPKWKEEILEYDVLLLKTNQKIKLSPGFVEVIKLPAKHNFIPKIDDKLWTCGWGLEQPKIRSTILKKIDLHVVSEYKCNEVWGPNDEKRICVASKQKGWGTCNGDSGGGLIFQGHLVGVLSYGTQECNLNEPEVYSDVHAYLDWIHSSMKKYK